MRAQVMLAVSQAALTGANTGFSGLTESTVTASVTFDGKNSIRRTGNALQATL